MVTYYEPAFKNIITISKNIIIFKNIINYLSIMKVNYNSAGDIDVCNCVQGAK